MTLVVGTDHSVSYDYNLETCTASGVIPARFESNYKGWVRTTFTIVADKTELDNVVAEADDLYGSIVNDYPDIAATLLEAIDDAKGVQADGDASQQEVEDAVKALRDAMQAAKDAIATGIAVVKTDAKGDWYDMNGRRLNGKPATKGVYVRDGRKVVVK